MKAILATAIALGLTACTAKEGLDPQASLEEGCDAGDAGQFTGRPATAELAAEVQKRTGAHAFRWLQPGQVVTMEYRADRVNVHLDDQNRVKSVNCG